MAARKPSGIVYSTNPDFEYAYDGAPEKDTPEPARQDLRVWLEKNHRGGKMMTVIRGFTGKTADMDALARRLKTSCGTGGSVKEGEILVQGDMREKVLRLLADWGYKAKKAGG